MGLGTQSTDLRGPLAPRCACFPPAGFVYWPIWPQNGSTQGPRAPGWAPVGSGGRVLGRNPLQQRVDGVPFIHVLPVFTLSTVSFSPKAAPNGTKRGLMAPGHAPPGSGCRILGRNPLGQHVGCLRVMFCLFFSSKWCVVRCGSKTAPNGSENGQN